MYGLLWLDNIWEDLRMQKHLNIEKIVFKVVQMKFLVMLITNQKIKFSYIYIRYDLLLA